MANSIYIETSIISYLTSRMSRNLVAAARQQITHDWWESRLNYDLYISEIVYQECAAGDPHAAKKRLDAINGLIFLRVTTKIKEIAKDLIARDIIPTKAADDALHIAIATIHAMDFLLTWNCKHIANPDIQKRIALYLEERGLFLPFICTPNELLEANSYE